MTMSRVVSSILAIGLFGAVLAQEEMHMKVELLSDDGTHEPILIEIDSDDMGGNLHDMQEGENRSIIDKQGRAILITRTADGFVFDVDGKTIEMPMIHGQHGMVAMSHGDVTADVDVHVMHDGVSATAASAGTLIMTDKPVDEATQQAISAMLESAGHEGEVRFVDHETISGGPHHVKVVRRVEITE